MQSRPTCSAWPKPRLIRDAPAQREGEDGLSDCVQLADGPRPLVGRSTPTVPGGAAEPSTPCDRVSPQRVHETRASQKSCNPARQMPLTIAPIAAIAAARSNLGRRDSAARRAPAMPLPHGHRRQAMLPYAKAGFAYSVGVPPAPHNSGTRSKNTNSAIQPAAGC